VTADSTSSAAPPAALVGIGTLFGAIYFVQGAGDPSSGLIAQPVRSLLNGWGESPAAIATFMAIMALPWSLKPLLALLSDFVPLLGSRRRSYLVIATATAALGLGALYALPLPANHHWLLLPFLFVPTLGIAFTDVLVDGLMIEVGKPRGLTGALQSVQWTAAYLALLSTGALGGWLVSRGLHTTTFLICALLWTGSLVLTLAFVREPPQHVSALELRDTAAELKRAFAVPGLVTICVFSFLWDMNPLSASINYLNATTTLGLSEQVFGNAASLFSAGGMAASFAYGLYCRRLTPPLMLHGAIVTGIAANVLYWLVRDAQSYYVVSALAGLAYMTGSMILLDLAARLVPLPVAATVFAVIMALANLGSVVAEAVGGAAFEGAAGLYGAPAAYRIVIVASVLVMGACAAFVPRLRRELR
jgi:predicted MFS family arabinose efflux permease